MTREGRAHAGIIRSDQLPVGVLLRRPSNLCFQLPQEEMANRVEFLGSSGPPQDQTDGVRTVFGVLFGDLACLESA
jgi:hypothetical protein